MDKNHEVFDDYVMQFDLNDEEIKYKYNHSYRVMKISKDIAKHLNFDEDGILLAETIGLFHDIGRFKQWTEYKTFNNEKSLNHGEVGCDILFKENLIDKLQIPKNSEEVISKAIYNHDKFEYDDEDYDEIDKIYCDLIRDADKLDICFALSEGLLNLTGDDSEISEKVRNDFFNQKLINNKHVNTNNEKIIKVFGLIFDLSFDYSRARIKDYIEKIYKKLDKNIFKEYYEFAKEYLKEGEKNA